MTNSNYVYEKGTILVAPGGGGALTPLLPGASGQALFANPAVELGVEWGDGSAMGDVVGPVSSVANNLAAFADTSGTLLEDSGIATDDVAIGAGSSTLGNLMSFDSTDGKTIADSGILATSVVVGPASATDNAVARFNLTTGKLIQDSPVTMADTTGAMTFPSGGGVIMTAGAGAAERKGTVTLSSGTAAKILTTAAVTGCVIVYSVVTLGTVTAAQAILTTIDTGVGFTPVSADVTDTSVLNWAIVG